MALPVCTCKKPREHEPMEMVESDKAGEIQQVQSDGPKRRCTDGPAVMRKAANQVLATDGPEIMRGMGKGAAGGHVQCLRVMLELAREEQMLKAGKARKRRRSRAMEWGREAEWPRPPQELEMGFIGAEPEQV
ncbi:MAG TPA: hypothetical protein VIY53_01825 [Acidobacteriaceae bacterium]